MEDSAATPGLTAPSLPFFSTTEQTHALSGSEADDNGRVRTSPEAMAQHPGPSSDEETHAGSHPGSLIGNFRRDQQSRYSPSASLLQHPAFQDYNLGYLSTSQDGFDNASISNGSISPLSTSNQPFNFANSGGLHDDGARRIGDFHGDQLHGPSSTGDNIIGGGGDGAGVTDGGRTARNSLTPQGDLSRRPSMATSFGNGFLQAPRRADSQQLGSIGAGRPPPPSSFKGPGPSPTDATKENAPPGQLGGPAFDIQKSNFLQQQPPIQNDLNIPMNNTQGEPMYNKDVNTMPGRNNTPSHSLYGFNSSFGSNSSIPQSSFSSSRSLSLSNTDPNTSGRVTASSSFDDSLPSIGPVGNGAYGAAFAGGLFAASGSTFAPGSNGPAPNLNRLSFLQPPNTLTSTTTISPPNLAPSPVAMGPNERPSLSRASSRSMSMNSNAGSTGPGNVLGGALYDRPPSSFDHPAPFHPQQQQQQQQRHRPMSMVSTGSSAGAGMPGDTSSAFEDQVRALPFVQDLLDRLLRCEYSTKEIQRDLTEMSRKVSFLLERAESGDGPNRGTGQLGNGKLAGNGADEVRALAQRLDNLSTSVQHLVALQTQAHVQGQHPKGHNQNQHGHPNLPNVNPPQHANANGISPLTSLGPNGLTSNSNSNLAALNNHPNSNNNIPPSSIRPEHLSGNGPVPPNQHRNSLRGITGMGATQVPQHHQQHQQQQGQGNNNNSAQRNWSGNNAEINTPSVVGLGGGAGGGRRESDIGPLMNGPMGAGSGSVIRDKRKMSLNVARRDSTSVSETRGCEA